jgi:hypothetical protein
MTLAGLGAVRRARRARVPVLMIARTVNGWSLLTVLAFIA